MPIHKIYLVFYDDSLRVYKSVLFMHTVPGPGGPCLDQICPGHRPGWRVVSCAARFPGPFGDVVSRFQQLRQRTPCGGYGAGGEGRVSGINSPEKQKVDFIW